MKLKIANTGSYGNGYVLGNDNEALILEVGVSFMEIKQLCDFHISHINGILITHKHSDHYKYFNEYKDCGIDTLRPWIDNISSKKFGNFYVQPFEVPHCKDVKCFGFYINHIDLKRCLFITDCEYVPFDFKPLLIDHIIVECNYCSDLVSENARNIEHKLKGHMSLDTCKEFVRHCKTDDLKTITLIHLGRFADKERILTEIKEIVGNNVTVNIAEKGKIINLGGTNE